MRGFRTLVLIVVAFAMTVGLSAAQSLAELAKKEKKRRDSNQAETSRVITDRELTRANGGLPAQLPTGGEAPGNDGGSEATPTDGAETATEPEDDTKTAAYWQSRVKGAKDKITRLEQQLNSDDWGDGQRVGTDPRGINNLSSRETASRDLAAARSELEAIRAEARRAGAPPGWVR